MQKVENIMANGEIARSEQYHLLPQGFQNVCCRHIRKRLFWERVNSNRTYWQDLDIPNYEHAFTQDRVYSQIKQVRTRNITEGDEYPQLVPDNIHMYEKFKGPELI